MKLDLKPYEVLDLYVYRLGVVIIRFILILFNKGINLSLSGSFYISNYK